jgi:hypothetical protein
MWSLAKALLDSKARFMLGAGNLSDVTVLLHWVLVVDGAFKYGCAECLCEGQNAAPNHPAGAVVQLLHGVTFEKCWPELALGKIAGYVPARPTCHAYMPPSPCDGSTIVPVDCRSTQAVEMPPLHWPPLLSQGAFDA